MKTLTLVIIAYALLFWTLSGGYTAQRRYVKQGAITPVAAIQGAVELLTLTPGEVRQ